MKKQPIPGSLRLWQLVVFLIAPVLCALVCLCIGRMNVPVRDLVSLLLGYWCELDGDETIHLDNFELADGAWVSREELRRDYRDNGVALTSEMIARFAAGREYEPVSE